MGKQSKRSSDRSLLLAGCLLGLLSGPENRDSMFLRNVAEHLPDYTMSHPKRQYKVIVVGTATLTPLLSPQPFSEFSYNLTFLTIFRVPTATISHFNPFLSSHSYNLTFLTFEFPTARISHFNHFLSSHNYNLTFLILFWVPTPTISHFNPFLSSHSYNLTF
jgi:hypothetical protein